MRKNSDLEDTKPIEIIPDDLESVEEVPSREEKFKDKNLEDTIEAEKILDDELITISEEERNALESEEKPLDLEIEEKKEEPKKEKKKLIDKWKELPTGKKVLVIICISLFIALLAILMVFALSRKPKEKVKPKEKEKEQEVITIVDNYYYKDGNLYLVDANDKEIGSYECKNKDKDNCYVAINTYRDTLDVPKVSDENNEAKIERMPIYNNDYVFIYDDSSANGGKTYLYSMKTKDTIGEYLDTKGYDKNFIILKTMDNKYGFYQINESMITVFNPIYNELFYIDGEDYLVGYNNKGYVILTKNGKEISKYVPGTAKLKYYNKNFMVFEDNSNYSVYNSDGKMVKDKYRFITVKEGFIFLIDDSNKMYVIDGDGAKYNEEGIALKNTDYVSNYIYDSNGKIAKTMLAYKIEVTKESIEIMPYNKRYEEDINVSININEGLVSKNLKNYNYLQGNLYFYKDEEKKELIGFYKCTNPNSLVGNNTELVNCNIAKDEIFEDNDSTPAELVNRQSTIPLINERFVFIQDGAKNIVLYDLAEKKGKASYSKVNTYTPNNNNTFTLYSGNVELVAVNKKNKFGVVSINGAELQGIHPFDYDHVEKLNDKYIGKNSNNKWVILGETNEYADKIMGIKGNFIKLKKNTYSVVKIDSNEKIGAGYKYVELYDNYYAGVDSSNYLMIYDYNGDDFIKDKILLSNNNYSKVENPAFKISSKIEEDKYVFTISVFDGTTYKDNVVKQKETTIIGKDDEEEPKEEDKDKEKDKEKDKDKKE